MVDPVILIVNADDFGFSEGVNLGIIQAHEQGIVTSTSLMVRGAAIESAVEYARYNPRLSVGLHIDLGEWSYRDGGWQIRYAVVPLEDPELVRAEIHRQLAAFRSWLQREPTHMDSHQHVHRNGAPQQVALEIAKELAIPLRHESKVVRYCGHFYGQPYPGESSAESVGVAALAQIIRTLPSGITELTCHPGHDEQLASDYAQERVWETETLCDPAVKAAIESSNVLLRSFASPDVRNRLGLAIAKVGAWPKWR